MGTTLSQLGSSSPMNTVEMGGLGRLAPGQMARFNADPIISLWNKRASEFDQHRQLFQADFTRYWRYYRAWRAPMSEPMDWWRSNEVIPTCFKIIETLYPKYLFGIFDSPDWFNVKGTEATDEVWELGIEALLHEQIEEMKAVPKVMEALKYCTIMGHVWGKVVWKEEYTTRQIMQPKMQMDAEMGIPTGVGMEKLTVTDKTADRPDFDWRPLDVIKTATDGSERWYIEEILTTLEELQDTDKKMGGGLYNDLDKIVGSSAASSTSDPSYREPQNTEGTPQWQVEHRDGTKVTLWQCWGWIPPQLRKPSESEWRLTVIANKSIKIRDVDAPTPDGKPPYFPVKCIPIPGRLFGESPLKYVGPLADQQSRLSNHILDEWMLNIWGQLIIDSSAGITNNEMLFQPGGALFVQGNPAEKVMVFPRQRMDPNVYRELDYRQTQAEHAIGATDTMQGIGENDRTTAQEINAKLTQGGMRVTAQILWFQETLVKPLLTRTYQFLQMRMPEEKVVRIIGADGMQYNVQLNIQNLQIPVDITISGGLLGISKQSQTQNFQEMIALGASPVFGPYLRPGSILNKYYRLKGERAIDAFVKSDQEVQMAAMAGMGPEGMGGGQAPMGAGQDQGGDGSTGEPMSMPESGEGEGMAAGPGPSAQG